MQERDEQYEQFLRLGDNNFGNRRFQEAFHFYTALVTLCEQHKGDKSFSKNSAVAYHRRGRFCYAIKRYDDALQDLSKAYDLDNDELEYLFDRGYAYYRLKAYDNALKDFKEVLRRLDDDLSKGSMFGHCRVHYALARAYEMTGELEDARKNYEAMFKPDPKLDISHYVAWKKFSLNHPAQQRQDKSIPPVGLLDHKEKDEILASLEELGDDVVKIELLFDCLDKTTCFGERLWRQEGRYPCDYGAGSIKSVMNHLIGVIGTMNTDVQKMYYEKMLTGALGDYLNKAASSSSSSFDKLFDINNPGKNWYEKITKQLKHLAKTEKMANYGDIKLK